MDEDRLIDALAKISDQLGVVAAAVKAATAPAPAVGFGVSPRPTVVYCNRTKGGVWYTLEYPAGGGEPVAVDIPERCLTARLRGLTFPKREHRNKEHIKMCLHVDAGRHYILETGHDTMLAKCLYADIASMTVEQLMQPVTIELRAADTDTVIFSKIYTSDGNPVNSDALKDASLRSNVDLALDKLNRATGQVVE